MAVPMYFANNEFENGVIKVYLARNEYEYSDVVKVWIPNYPNEPGAIRGYVVNSPYVAQMRVYITNDRYR